MLFIGTMAYAVSLVALFTLLELIFLAFPLSEVGDGVLSLAWAEVSRRHVVIDQLADLIFVGRVVNRFSSTKELRREYWDIDFVKL